MGLAMMDLELNEAQRAARDTARRFARERLTTLGVEVDRTHRFPAEAIAELGRLGMMGIFIPEQYGGAGLDHVSYSLVIEELGVECSSTAVILSAHSSLASWPILGMGNEEQRMQYLPKMAAAEWIGCFALTEPQAGSDAAGQRTRAVRDGDSYVINGTKNFITNGPEAGVAIVFASTDPSQGHRGISAFIAETSDPGYQVVRIEEKMGIRGSHSAQLAFSDLRVPASNLIGKEGDGFKVAMKTLDGGRIGIASQAIGIARAALEASLQLRAGTQEVRQADREVPGDPVEARRHGDRDRRGAPADCIARRTLKDAGLPCTTRGGDGEALRGRDRDEGCTEAVQIHGGYGYTKEFKVERHFRDAKITEIYEGTSEIQRLIISSHVLEDR